MPVLDLAYHMRDHTPRWLRRLNLFAFVALIIPAMLQWSSAWIAFGGIAAVNWIVGYRSLKRGSGED